MRDMTEALQREIRREFFKQVLNATPDHSFNLADEDSEWRDGYRSAISDVCEWIADNTMDVSLDYERLIPLNEPPRKVIDSIEVQIKPLI